MSLERREFNCMKLFKTKIVRDGSRYVDLNLCWQYQGKTYVVRVRPCFGKDNDKLIAIAEPLPSGELPEKYL